MQANDGIVLVDLLAVLLDEVVLREGVGWVGLVDHFEVVGMLDEEEALVLLGFGDGAAADELLEARLLEGRGHLERKVVELVGLHLDLLRLRGVVHYIIIH